jgi:V8-like Glu-specific endopeptidase
MARDTETGKLLLLTAGHCLAGSGLSALWSHHGAAIGRASVEAFHPGSDADVGAIDLTNARPSNEVYGSGETNIRSVTALASNASQATGSQVCRSGAASGWRCGTIVAADVDATIGGTLIHHTWWTDFPSAAGDSGSPVLDQDGRAAGILIATTPTRSLYSTVDWIATELHARPCVTPGCD